MSLPLEFPGNPRLRRQLESALASGRLAGAYIFEGAAGAGQEQAALALAGGFITGATDPADEGLTRVRRYSHPDLHYLVPVLKPGSRPWSEMKEEEFIELFREQQARKIEDPYYTPSHSSRPHLPIKGVRSVLRRIANKSFEGGGRALIVRDADQLANDAQDSLLKTLEEPPPGCLIILISYRAESLRPTILSRCQRLPFDPLGRETILAELNKRGLEADRAEFFATLADGDMEQAIRFATAESEEGNPLLEERSENFALLDVCEFDTELRMLDAIQHFCKSKRLGNPVIARAGFLAQAISWYRELLRQEAGGGDLIVHVDQGDRLRRYRELSQEALLLRIRACEKARRQILGYTNTELTLLSLFFSLRAAQGRARGPDND